MAKLPMRKTATLEQAKNAFKGERFVNALNSHLVKVGQIKVFPKEDKKLSPEGKKALLEYARKTGLIKEGH